MVLHQRSCPVCHVGFYMSGPWWELCLQPYKPFNGTPKPLWSWCSIACLSCISPKNLSPFFCNTNQEWSVNVSNGNRVISSCLVSSFLVALPRLAISPIYMWNISQAQLCPWPFALSSILKALTGQQETERSLTLACCHLHSVVTVYHTLRMAFVNAYR